MPLHTSGTSPQKQIAPNASKFFECGGRSMLKRSRARGMRAGNAQKHGLGALMWAAGCGVTNMNEHFVSSASLLLFRKKFGPVFFLGIPEKQAPTEEHEFAQWRGAPMTPTRIEMRFAAGARRRRRPVLGEGVGAAVRVQNQTLRNHKGADQAQTPTFPPHGMREAFDIGRVLCLHTSIPITTAPTKGHQFAQWRGASMSTDVMISGAVAGRRRGRTWTRGLVSASCTTELLCFDTAPVSWPHTPIPITNASAQANDVRQWRGVSVCSQAGVFGAVGGVSAIFGRPFLRPRRRRVSPSLCDSTKPSGGSGRFWRVGGANPPNSLSLSDGLDIHRSEQVFWRVGGFAPTPAYARPRARARASPGLEKPSKPSKPSRTQATR